MHLPRRWIWCFCYVGWSSEMVALGTAWVFAELLSSFTFTGRLFICLPEPRYGLPQPDVSLALLPALLVSCLLQQGSQRATGTDCAPGRANLGFWIRQYSGCPSILSPQRIWLTWFSKTTSRHCEAAIPQLVQGPRDVWSISAPVCSFQSGFAMGQGASTMRTELSMLSACGRPGAV